MEVGFKCLQDGTRFYSVRRNGLELFVGTRGECARYIGIHNAKVAQEQRDALRPQRNRAVHVRTYRQTRTPA